MLVNQWSMTGRVLDPSLVLYFSFEADIHNIQCRAIFLRVGKFYLRMAKCRDRVPVTEIVAECCFLFWRGQVLLALLYIP